MSPKLMVQPEKCTGCKSCMLMCAFAHTNGFSYRDSRVLVVKNESRGQSTPLVCRHCEEAPCIEACPQGAITRDTQSDRVILDEGECNGCEACLDACPYQAIHLDDERGVVLICDLCEGDPQCVKVCRFPEALVWA